MPFFRNLFSLFAFEVCVLAQFKTKQAEACSTGQRGTSSAAYEAALIMRVLCRG